MHLYQRTREAGHGRGVEVPAWNVIGDLFLNLVGEYRVTAINDRATDDHHYDIDPAVVHECVRRSGDLSLEVLATVSWNEEGSHSHHVLAWLLAISMQFGGCVILLLLGMVAAHVES